MSGEFCNETVVAPRVVSVTSASAPNTPGWSNGDFFTVTFDKDTNRAGTQLNHEVNYV